jgi:hypothetical protein
MCSSRSMGLNVMLSYSNSLDHVSDLSTRHKSLDIVGELSSIREIQFDREKVRKII